MAAISQINDFNQSDFRERNLTRNQQKDLREPMVQSWSRVQQLRARGLRVQQPAERDGCRGLLRVPGGAVLLLLHDERPHLIVDDTFKQLSEDHSCFSPSSSTLLTCSSLPRT